MPRLDADAVNRVEEAESGSSVMDEGIYEMFLVSVEAKQGQNGPYWKWTFKIAEDAKRYAKWQQWLNTSLSEKSAWKLKEVFAAFGVTPDVDTDDLIGQTVRVEVGQNTIQAGTRAGEIGNNVKRVLPLEAGGNSQTEGSGNLF